MHHTVTVVSWYAYHVCDLIGMASEGSDYSSRVSVYYEDDEAVTGHG